MKNVVVTGANGFVGRWLVWELNKHDINVYAVVKDENENISAFDGLKNVNVVYCQLNEIESLYNKINDKVDTFYHLAWAGTAGSARANYELQLMNTVYTCDAACVAKKLGCNKFLCAGTITEKIAENILNLDTKAENIIYGLQKHNAHCMLDIICKREQLDYVWMRFSNIFGPHNMSGNIVSYLLGELIKGNVPEFSKGEQPYDLIFVKDLVYAMYLLGEKQVKNNCYFIGSGTPRLLKDYLIEMRDAFGDAEIALGKRPEDGLKYDWDWFDVCDLSNDVGYKSQYKFEDAIIETIDWIKSV